MRSTEFVASVEVSVLRAKRDQVLNSARTLKNKQHLCDYLERKAEIAVRGGSAAQKRLTEAEAALQIRR